MTNDSTTDLRAAAKGLFEAVTGLTLEQKRQAAVAEPIRRVGELINPDTRPDELELRAAAKDLLNATRGLTLDHDRYVAVVERMRRVSELVEPELHPGSPNVHNEGRALGDSEKVTHRVTEDVQRTELGFVEREEHSDRAR